ncbi:M48 family metalloprotease [Desulfobacula sp.]
MFANFLYFLIVLIMYSSSELFENVGTIDSSVVFYSLMVTILFIVVCHIAFKWLGKKAGDNPYENIDSLINKYISRLSNLALMIFALIIYGFKLNLFFSGIKIFKALPTLEAILFLGLFLFYLIVIWNAAYEVQKRNFAGQVSKKNFILSNVSFSLPALLPWFFLSIIADILGLLPWQPAKQILNTPAGEIGYITLFLVAIAVFGPVLIKKIWNCNPLEPGLPRTRIEMVLKKAKVKYSDILTWDLFGGTMLTAGVMGLVGRFRYILVTPSLLNSLNDDELIAVMLHEIGHVQKYHMVFYLIFFAGFIGCNFVFLEPFMMLLYVFEPLYKVFGFVGIGKSTAHPILISFTLIGLFILYFRFIFGFFMRNFERQADLHVYRFTRDASPLISTFYKIASFSRQSIDKPNWHHYSIGRRVRFLERCQTNPALIQAHHLKVKKMIVGYFVLIMIIFGFGYAINFGMAKETFDTFIAEKILFQQKDFDPAKFDLYAFAGDYYYNKKNYEKAIESYENVLKADPDNVHALNNLSWLFSTCPDKGYRNNKKALEYAKRTLVQKREAFVLDTYAEALFVNNDIKAAVSSATQALTLSKDKKEYYKSQLERFEKILNP